VHEWTKKIYSQRLIDALGHPLDDVRMRAIITLGLRSEKAAEKPLIDCALRQPIDVIEGLEIVNSLRTARAGWRADNCSGGKPEQSAIVAITRTLRSVIEGPASFAFDYFEIFNNESLRNGRTAVCISGQRIILMAC
jgi:hypothetical protein